MKRTEYRKIPSLQHSGKNYLRGKILQQRRSRLVLKRMAMGRGCRVVVSSITTHQKTGGVGQVRLTRCPLERPEVPILKLSVTVDASSRLASRFLWNT